MTNPEFELNGFLAGAAFADLIRKGATHDEIERYLADEIEKWERIARGEQ